MLFRSYLERVDAGFQCVKLPPLSFFNMQFLAARKSSFSAKRSQEHERVSWIVDSISRDSSCKREGERVSENMTG